MRNRKRNSRRKRSLNRYETTSGAMYINKNRFSRRSLLRQVGFAAFVSMALSGQKACAQQGSGQYSSIRQAATATGRWYGAALAIEMLEEAQYREIVARECNIAVAENAFKWGQVETRRGDFNFEPSDTIARFCRQHDIALRGHCLLWHRSLPDWLPQETFPPVATVERWMERIMQRYPNVVAWDVINEIIDEQENGRTYNLRFNATPDYVQEIYRRANAISRGKAELVYNDFGTEGSSEWNLNRQKHVLGLLKSLVDQNVGLSGFGMQSHLRTNLNDTDFAAIQSFIRAVKDLGLKVYVTELDFLLSSEQRPQSIREADRIIADAYHRYLDVVLSEGVDTVVTWGITDRSTWLRQVVFNQDAGRPETAPFVRPLLYDDQYQPKAARDAVLNAFRRR